MGVALKKIIEFKKKNLENNFSVCKKFSKLIFDVCNKFILKTINFDNEKKCIKNFWIQLLASIFLKLFLNESILEIINY